MKTALVILIFLIINVSFGCLENPKTMTKAECDAYWFQQEVEMQHKMNNVSKPYSEIHVAVVQQYNNYVSIDGVVEIFNAAGYPFTPIAEIDVKSGCGTIEFNEHNYSVFSHTDYYTAFNGKSNYYDMWYVNENIAPLPHHVTTDDTNTVQLLFEDIVKVGYFEPQEHQLINLSNQTSFEFDICVLGNYEAIKNPVLCFVNDLEQPFEGAEFKKDRFSKSNINIPPVTLTKIDGSDFNVLYDITDIVNDGNWNNECVPLGHYTDNDRWIYGGSCGRYRIDFNHICQDYLISGKDIMYVYLDDLNGYRNRDIMFYAKASPLHVATITG